MSKADDNRSLFRAKTMFGHQHRSEPAPKATQKSREELTEGGRRVRDFLERWNEGKD